MRGPATSRRAAIAFGVVAATIAAALIANNLYRESLARPRSAHVKNRNILLLAVGNSRLIEGRLAGGFPYVSFASSMRGHPQIIDSLSLLGAAGELQRAADKEPSPFNVEEFGVAELLLQHFDPALTEIEFAIGASPRVPEFYVDLSAGLIARARLRRSGLDDLTRAVNACEQALSLVPGLPEAQFNLALALESIGVRTEALQAWTDYLKTDAVSGWSNDAKAHLESLSQQSRDRSQCLDLEAASVNLGRSEGPYCPQETREIGETLLAGWARAALNSKEREASSALARADSLGSALVAWNGDRLLRDAVDWIRFHPDRQLTLAKAHTAFAAGQDLYVQDHRHLALNEFSKALALLKEEGSPYWLVAAQNIARLHLHKRELDDASLVLEEVSALAAERSYLALQARAAWSYGIVKLQKSDPSGALDQYQHAASIFEQIGELGNLSNVANAAADTERILGDFQRGWIYLSTSLSHLSSVGDPTRRYLAFYNGALYAHRENLELAALHFQNEALVVARKRRGPAGVIEGSINRAAILGRIKRPDEGLRALDEIAPVLSSLDDPQQRAYMTARVAAVRGELLVAERPDESVAQLQAAIRHFSSAEPAEVPRLRLLEGEAFQRGADEAHAAAAYLNGARSFEERLRRLNTDQQRVAYSDEGWEIYRRLVDLRIGQGLFNEALGFSEQARFRTGRDSEERFSPSRVSGLLTASQRLVFYTVLQTETHAWVFSDSGLEHHLLPIGEAQLAQAASEITGLINRWHSAGRLEKELESLYSSLIAPLNMSDNVREVIVVPDGPLRLVPFASLRDPFGRYLIERWAIAVSNSLELGANALASTRERSNRPEATALVVGNPRFDRERSPELRPLVFAEGEAANVARLYPRSRVLLGTAATKRAVLSSLPSADVFHFAGHAIANDEFPELSRLLLTSVDDDDGELLARDLERSHLKRGAVVVLSACQTGAGAERRATGVQSLAQAFLAVGAGEVIAALWDVNDRDASELMIAFHERLAGGETPAKSLQYAQRKLIAAGLPVAAWAAFVPFEGVIKNTLK
jgi:CHAT domain-containing protein